MARSQIQALCHILRELVITEHWVLQQQVKIQYVKRDIYFVCLKISDTPSHFKSDISILNFILILNLLKFDNFAKTKTGRSKQSSL